ncbi:MAG: phosphatase PAP2 family protein [Pseudomonadota bacterium]
MVAPRAHSGGLAALYWTGLALLLPVTERLTAPPCAFDRAWLDGAARLRSVRLDGFFLAITWAGSLYLLLPATLAAIGWLMRRRRWSDARLLGLSLAGASAIAHGMKPLFGRARPDLYPPLVPVPADASFPSAHAAQITACVVAVLVLRVGGKYASWAASAGITLAAAVGLSRVYLQVHYASDVAAGVLLALFWVLGLEALLKALSRPGRSSGM